MSRHKKFCWLLALVSLGAQAATYTVTSDADGGGACPDAANCTLRDAIAAASSGSDIIVFKNDMTITLASTLTLTNDVTIDATSLDVSVDGNNSVTVFHVNPGTTAQIANLRIQNGLSNSGGGIYNEGTLTLTESTLSGNSADGTPGLLGEVGVSGPSGTAGGFGGSGSNAQGGAIFNSGALTLVGCILSTNVVNGGVGGAGGSGGSGMGSGTSVSFGGPGGRGGPGGNGEGGAIYNSGTLMLVDSTLSSNRANGGVGGEGGEGGYGVNLSIGDAFGGAGGNGAEGGTGSGGGIYSSGTFVLIGSTLLANGANGGVGGVGGNGGSGDSGSGNGNGGAGGNGSNGGTGSGGGIYNSDTFTLIGSTLLGNSVVGGSGGSGGTGGNVLSAVGEGGAGGNGGDGAGNTGGGISNFDSLTLTGTTLSGNSTISGVGGGGGNGGSGGFSAGLNGSGGVGGLGGNGGAGGGIYNSNTLTLVNSTLSSNAGGNGGSGGIGGNSGGSAGSVPSVGGNGGDGGNGSSGAGIYSSSMSTLTNDTLSGNAGGSGGASGMGGVGSDGGPSGTAGSAGVSYLFAGIATVSGVVTFTNTIVTDGCAGTQTDSGGNIDTGTSCGFGVGSQSNVSNLNLGALADNGGPTQTMLPGAGSAAINAIACTNAPPVDQRNYVRPNPSSVGLATACDVGAVEVGSVPDLIFANGFGSPPLYR